MSNQLILIVTHGNLSTNKMLLKSIQQKGLDTKFAMIVNYKAKDKDTGREKYNLEYLVASKEEPDKEQKLLLTLLPNNETFFDLGDLVEKYFDCLDKLILELRSENKSSIFDFHLFLEVNLSDVGSESLTKAFHDALHLFGDSFKKLVGESFKNFYVYGFSDTKAARDKAQRYFNSEVVDNLKLSISIDYHFVDIKRKIHHHIIIQEEDITHKSKKGNKFFIANNDESTSRLSYMIPSIKSTKKTSNSSLFKSTKSKKIFPETLEGSSKVDSSILLDSDKKLDDDDESKNNCCNIS